MTTSTDLLRIWDDFAALWNGDYSLAGIVEPDFRLHAALIDGSPSSAVRGPEGLVTWIQQARAPFSEIQFTTEVGPLVSGDHVIGRWQASGTYAGGVPGAKTAVGAQVTFAGNDILRVEGGRVVDYWTCADTLAMLSQLGVI
jgi:predicted ester cyclase